MSRIFWDTNLFIYFMEDYGQLSARVARIAERILERGDQLYTSTLSLGEALVKPIEQNNELLREKLDTMISRYAILIPFDEHAARIYALIRRDRTLKAPDAIQLACAAHARVDLFITNDARLSERTIPGIQFIVPLQQAFL